MGKAFSVVYLTATPEDLFQRVAKDKTRPLLQVENPEKAYKEIFEKRDPLYREVADHIVMTDNRASPAKIAKSLYQLFTESSDQ